MAWTNTGSAYFSQKTANISKGLIPNSVIKSRKENSKKFPVFLLLLKIVLFLNIRAFPDDKGNFDNTWLQ